MMASDAVGELKIALSFDNNEFDSSVNEVEAKANGLGEKLSSTGAKLSKVFAGATAAASVAVGKIVTDTAKSFADYEQLIGGVETLFKDASSSVVEYANMAYETAGMSANTYMENVTSFSASLLQSLGGDTAAAAEIANQTIIDMSDNANKMGTDIERITDAYQGFAKQNYTMLDNLKLGYGGTKTEMERLLADATELSGIEYNIDNLNEVFEAIHVVQTELGVTGTTALEASTTISGSLNALKSAWQNTMTALGGGGDLDGAIEKLTSTAGTFIGNILPVLTKALSSISKLFSKLVPEITREIPKLVSALLPALLQAASQLVLGLIQALPDLIISLVQAIQEVLPQLLEGILAALPSILQAIVDGILLITLMLTSPANLQRVLDAAVQLLMSIVNALPQILTALSQTLPQIVNNIVTFLLDPGNLMLVIVAAVELFMGLVKAIPQVLATLLGSLGGVLDAMLGAIGEWVGPLIGSALNVANEFIETILRTIWELPGQLVEVGWNIVRGIWEGISGAAGWLWNQVTSFCSGILDAIKSFFGIHSPSKVFEDEVGAMLAEGIGVGFTVEMEDVSADMTSAIPTPASNDMSGWDRAIDTIFVEEENNVTTNERPLTIIQNNEIKSSLDIELVSNELLEQIRRTS